MAAKTSNIMVLYLVVVTVLVLLAKPAECNDACCHNCFKICTHDNNISE